MVRNVPRIRDMESQIALLEGIGVKVTGPARTRSGLQADSIGDVALTRALPSASVRRSCSPARCSRASARSSMPPPGGDTIGRRRLDPHLDAFIDMGAEVSGDRWVTISAPSGGLRACEIFMDEPSVMATENALMAASLTPGPTTIGNAACEPHVQDLARLLVKMGARIDGIGSNVMTVHGPDRLGGAEHPICPDHIEAASFMALAAATEGELRIRDAEPGRPRMIRRQFGASG